MQALAVAAKRSPTRGGRPEAQLERALADWWQTWAVAAGGGANVKAQAKLRSESWPGVGPVDLEIATGDRPRSRVWIEVKWRDLWNCPWDVAKLTLALREGLCDHAMLVAGASPKEWEGPGSEFFGDGSWSMATDVLEAHHASWLSWKADVKTRPLRLPRTLRTRAEPIQFPLGPVWPSWSLRAVHLLDDASSGWITVGQDRLATQA